MHAADDMYFMFLVNVMSCNLFMLHHVTGNVTSIMEMVLHHVRYYFSIGYAADVSLFMLLLLHNFCSKRSTDRCYW
jgi:hypothetical protein